MAETIKVAGADGFEFAAYHEPAFTPRKGGVIVIQEIFGIDVHVRADVERWAKMGYEAIAPSLYDRPQPGFTAGHGPDRREAGIGARHGPPPPPHAGAVRQGLGRGLSQPCLKTGARPSAWLPPRTASSSMPGASRPATRAGAAWSSCTPSGASPRICASWPANTPSAA